MSKNRRIPFGYMMQNGIITTNPAEVLAVLTIFSEYMVGKSLERIAINMKVPYSTDKIWNKNEDTTLKDMEMLIDYFEKREHIMIEFEPHTFEFLIDKIVVKDNNLEFHIVGSLVFTEKL